MQNHSSNEEKNPSSHDHGTARTAHPARFQTITECVEPGCKCDDRRGVILYDGPNSQAAEDAKRQSPTGYAVHVKMLEAIQ